MKKEELIEKVKETLGKSSSFNSFVSEVKNKGISVWLAHNKKNKDLLGISYRVDDLIIKGKDNDNIGLKHFYNKFDKSQLEIGNISPEFLLNKVEQRTNLDFDKSRNTITTPERLILPDDFKYPKQIYGVDVTEEIKAQLESGKWTDVINGFEIEGQSASEGRLRLQKKNDYGDYEIAFRLRQVELEIPNEINGRKLTEIEIAELTAGRVIGPFKNGKQDFYLQIDKELNRITVSKPGEFGLPKDGLLMGYQLTDEDKSMLVNGESLPMKTFKGANGYFKAEVTIEVKYGYLQIHIDKCEPLSKEQALAAQEELNVAQIKKMSNPEILDSQSVDIDNKELEKPQDNIELESHQDNNEIKKIWTLEDQERDADIKIVDEKEFITPEEKLKSNEVELFNKRVLEAIQKEDLKTLKGLVDTGAKKGIKPSNQLIETVSSSNNLTRTNKVASLMLLGKKEPSKSLPSKAELERKQQQQSLNNSANDKGKKLTAEQAKRKLDSGLNKVKGMVSDIS